LTISAAVRVALAAGVSPAAAMGMGDPYNKTDCQQLT